MWFMKEHKKGVQDCEHVRVFFSYFKSKTLESRRCLAVCQLHWYCCCMTVLQGSAGFFTASPNSACCETCYDAGCASPTPRTRRTAANPIWTPKWMDSIYGYLIFGGRGKDDFVVISSGWPSFFVVSACSSTGTCCRTSGKTIGSNRARLRRASTNKPYTWWYASLLVWTWWTHPSSRFSCSTVYRAMNISHKKSLLNSRYCFGWFLYKYNTSSTSCCGWHGCHTPFYLCPKAMCIIYMICISPECWQWITCSFTMLLKSLNSELCCCEAPLTSPPPPLGSRVRPSEGPGLEAKHGGLHLDHDQTLRYLHLCHLCDGLSVEWLNSQAAFAKGCGYAKVGT